MQCIRYVILLALVLNAAVTAGPTCPCSQLTVTVTVRHAYANFGFASLIIIDCTIFDYEKDGSILATSKPIIDSHKHCLLRALGDGDVRPMAFYLLECLA